MCLIFDARRFPAMLKHSLFEAVCRPLSRIRNKRPILISDIGHSVSAASNNAVCSKKRFGESSHF